jgi:hypothetical protein
MVMSAGLRPKPSDKLPDVRDPPVLHRFGDMRRLHAFSSCQIGNRPRDFEHAVVRARREMKRRDRLPEQRFPFGIEPAHGFDPARRELRVQLALTLRLPVRRCLNPRADTWTGFAIVYLRKEL